jgi:hypothetical protein
MAGKILVTVGDAVTLDLVDVLAERAGIDRASARKAAELGVPAILAGLTERVLRAGGVARMTQALQKGSIAWGQTHAGAAGVTAFLLGDQRAGALASAIGRFVGARASSTLIFLDDLTVAILGALRQASGDANAEGKVVANLLKAQSEDIAAAMPLGLATLLGTNGASERPQSVLPAATWRRDGSSVARSRAGSRAAWSLALLALMGLAWYLFAVGMKQQTGDNEPGHRVVTALPVPDAPPASQAGPRAELVAATAQLHRPDLLSSAREAMRSVTGLLGGIEGWITTALVRLGSLLGLGEGSLATLAADVGLLPDQGRAEERRLLGAATAARTGTSASDFGRPKLSFASAGFREAICTSPPIANEHRAGSGAVTQ